MGAPWRLGDGVWRVTMSESARARTALQWTGTIVLGVYILRRSELTLVWELLLRVLPAFLFIAAGLYVVDRLVAALKWRMLFVAYGSSLRFSAALSIILQSTFLGAAIPGTVGIDVIRARMVSRRGGSFAHSLSSVVVERIMGVVTLAVCALLGVGLFAPRSTWISSAHPETLNTRVPGGIPLEGRGAPDPEYP